MRFRGCAVHVSGYARAISMLALAVVSAGAKNQAIKERECALSPELGHCQVQDGRDGWQ